MCTSYPVLLVLVTLALVSVVSCLLYLLLDVMYSTVTVNVMNDAPARFAMTAVADMPW